MGLNTLLTGGAHPPPQLRELRAGPLSVVLDGVDLRYVRHGEVELVRRIYVAVRDRNWNTIPGVASDVAVDARADSFDVRFGVRHSSRDTGFSWEGSIAGTQEGLISFRMDGAGERDMLYNRIGFCVLHPWRESAGQRLRAITPDGVFECVLPAKVAPQRFEGGVYVPLFPSASGLQIELPGGGEVVFAFEGDLFETEDQRNWTDASLKTYCTPLALGFPHSLSEGELRSQTVSIHARGVGAPGEPAPARVSVGGDHGGRVPAIGLALPDDVPEPSDSEAGLLRALAPAHVRFDLHLGAPGWERALERAIAASRTLGTPLELVLFVADGNDGLLAPLHDMLASAAIARVLVVPEAAQTTTELETTPAPLVGLVRARLALGEVPVAGGTDMYFCELNRTRPVSAAMDGIFWSMNAQVHAFDDLSVMETPEAQGEQVRTARDFADGRPLFVGPVTLRRRYNVNATFAEEDTGGELPDSVDPRQASLMGAAWTLASAKHLAEQGADAVSYFETTGWRGVIQGDREPARPDRFPAVAGQVFPLFHVLADVAELRGRPVLVTSETRPLELAALAAGGDDATTVLLANLTAAWQTLELAGLGPRGRLRRLNHETAHEAMFEPGRFRVSSEPAVVEVLTLAPYETVRIDTQRRGQ